MGTTQILTKFSEYVQKVSTVPANLKKIRSVVTAISFLALWRKTKLKPVVGIPKIINYSRLRRGSHPITYINSGQIGSYLGGF